MKPLGTILNVISMVYCKENGILGKLVIQHIYMMLLLDTLNGFAYSKIIS